MSEDVVLQRSKRMLHRRSAQSHHFRSRSLPHALQGALIQVPLHQPSGGSCAAVFQRAGSTHLARSERRAIHSTFRITSDEFFY
jgi:hypothetical protein